MIIREILSRVLLRVGYYVREPNPEGKEPLTSVPKLTEQYMTVRSSSCQVLTHYQSFMI